MSACQPDQATRHLDHDINDYATAMTQITMQTLGTDANFRSKVDAYYSARSTYEPKVIDFVLSHKDSLSTRKGEAMTELSAIFQGTGVDPINASNVYADFAQRLSEVP